MVGYWPTVVVTVGSSERSEQRAQWEDLGLTYRVTGDEGLTPERGPERWPPHPRKAAGAQIILCRRAR